MFVIKGEGDFIGDKNIANGMELEDKLRKYGFMTAVKNAEINPYKSQTKIKRWQFAFYAQNDKR